MTQAKKKIRLSAIVPVTEGRYDDVAEVFEEYRDALAATGSSLEMIYVLDGELPVVREALRGLKDAGAPLTIVQMAKPYGEALAIMVGFEHASGEVILTLPAFRQVEPRALGGSLRSWGTPTWWSRAVGRARIRPTTGCRRGCSTGCSAGYPMWRSATPAATSGSSSVASWKRCTCTATSTASSRSSPTSGASRSRRSIPPRPRRIPSAACTPRGPISGISWIS